MFINKIVSWIVDLIMGYIHKAMYVAEKEHAKEKIHEAKRKAKSAKQESDRATAEFKLKLEQYRKGGRTGDLRGAIDGVRGGRGKAGANNSDSGSGN